MRLRDHMMPELVLVDVPGLDREAVLDAMAQALCRAIPNLECKTVWDGLMEREKKIATGLERGVAVPHTTLTGLEKSLLLVARLKQAVDFEALDGRPVDLVFMLLSPPECIASHIRLLARVARLCSAGGLLDAMREAKDAQDLLRVVEEEDGRHV